MPEPSRAPIDCITAAEIAARMLRDAGFVLFRISGQSESRYYYHPARGPTFLLRLSMHPLKKGKMIGLPGFVSKVTFPPTVAHSEWHAFNAVAMGIGRYFMVKVAPEPNYRGTKDKAHGSTALHV